MSEDSSDIAPEGGMSADPEPAKPKTIRTEDEEVGLLDPAVVERRPHRLAIGVDVGGSGIKAAAVDTATGRLVSDRIRVTTPDPSTPENVIAAIARIVRRIGRGVGRPDLPVGVDFPAVILGGRTMTATNVDQGWIEFPVVAALGVALGRPVAVINDADAAGLAEMRFGAGVGHRGVVLMLTLGTGVGSALFVDGRLVPNTELGSGMEIRGRVAERRSAAAARIRRGLSWKAWTADLDEHLHAIDRILWPDLLILGGGVSKNADKFLPKLTVRPPVVPATLRNEAGIIGAAMFAVEQEAGVRLEDAAVASPTEFDAPSASDATASAAGETTSGPGGSGWALRDYLRRASDGLNGEGV